MDNLNKSYGHEQPANIWADNEVNIETAKWELMGL